MRRLRAAGHSWRRVHRLPGPSLVPESPRGDPGFLDIGTDGKLIIYNTEQERLGAYTIEGDGRISIQITGVSSGKVLGVDRAVVSAMDAIGSDPPMFIRSTDKAALIVEAGIHKLTFTTQ